MCCYFVIVIYFVILKCFIKENADYVLRALHTVLQSSKWPQFLALKVLKKGHFLYAGGRQVIRDKIRQSILNKQCNGNAFFYFSNTNMLQMLPIGTLQNMRCLPHQHSLLNSRLS